MYFETSGRINTKNTASLALKAAKDLGIENIVVASNTGETALLFGGFQGNIVCVTHAFGFLKPGENELTADMKLQLQGKGIKILTASHVLSGAERSLSNHFGGIYPVEIIANTLRMFGSGIKVCVEISAMALDAGLIPYGQPVIGIGGTLRGADTALILTPEYTSRILDTKIHEVICKPFNL